MSSGSLKSLEVVLLPQVQSAGGGAGRAPRTQVRSREQAFPAAWEFLEGGPCPALRCSHPSACASRSSRVSPPGMLGLPPLSPSTGRERPGGPHTDWPLLCMNVRVRRVCVRACEDGCCPVFLHPPRGPPPTLRVKTLLRIVHFGESLAVNQCKLGGEIFLSCRVGIFYRLKVDQFFNTSKRENYLCIHMKYIYIYICMIINTELCFPRPARPPTRPRVCLSPSSPGTVNTSCWKTLHSNTQALTDLHIHPAFILKTLPGRVAVAWMRKGEARTISPQIKAVAAHTQAGSFLCGGQGCGGRGCCGPVPAPPRCLSGGGPCVT